MTLASPTDAKAAKAVGPLSATAAPVKPGKVGIMLVNLGTPDGTDFGPMWRYLREFLSDPRVIELNKACLLYTSPSPRDRTRSRMPSSA